MGQNAATDSRDGEHAAADLGELLLDGLDDEHAVELLGRVLCVDGDDAELLQVARSLRLRQGRTQTRRQCWSSKTCPPATAFDSTAR
jgi:hypothetical protein